MGHERTGVLPRTTKWRNVVDELARYSRNNVDVGTIGKKVLENVRSRFSDIADDGGVNAAFSFLLVMACAGKNQTSASEVAKNVIGVSLSDSEIQLAKGVNRWIENNVESREYGEIAKEAVIDTISDWVNALKTRQEVLFGKADTNEEAWTKASDGAGFCELSRLFFSNFTERYLRYFLERELGAQLSNWDDPNRLRDELHQYIKKASKYAFETAKITQSFAAGWYNKNTKEGLPSQKKVSGFLWLAFEKLREELKRENYEE